MDWRKGPYTRRLALSQVQVCQLGGLREGCWADDCWDPFHFFKSQIPHKGYPSCLLPVTYSYSHPGLLCLFLSDLDSLKVHTPPLLSELKATNPLLTPSTVLLWCHSGCYLGSAPGLAVSVRTSHMYLSPPYNTYARALQRSCLHFFVPPSPSQCLRW